MRRSPRWMGGFVLSAAFVVLGPTATPTRAALPDPGTELASATAGPDDVGVLDWVSPERMRPHGKCAPFGPFWLGERAWPGDGEAAGGAPDDKLAAFHGRSLPLGLLSATCFPFGVGWD